MKKTATAIIAALCCLTIAAQRTPTHSFDFEATDWSKLASFFDSWQPGTPPPGVSKTDDEFFISRQRPLERISDDRIQANAGAKPQRKLFLWTPLDDPSSRWNALPRYSFEGDNFSMWQYIDSHGNWSAPWLRVAAGISDAAAKNGVSVGCVLSIPWNATVSLDDSTGYSRILKKFTEKAADGTFRNSDKLARLMKYYGINALGVNSEFNADSATMALLRDFFVDVHRKATDIGWRFELQWYDITDDSGRLSLDRGLGQHNRRMFGSGDSIVADRLFANYNWTPELLKSSAAYARDMRRSPYDYYAGFDIQGRALKNRYWQDLIDSDISIGIWGAHSQSLIHQSATDDGSSCFAIQDAYLQKQELIFSGGNRNPAVTPPVRNDCSLSNVDLQTFHGLARLLTAKSTIQNIPFVTRFNMGNGYSLFRKGKGIGTENGQWYNLGMQDFLPTWRFWITDENDEATEDDLPNFVDAELTWDDSYCGGSCLQLRGNTKFSRVKLFKTKLATLPSYEMSVTYSMDSAAEGDTKIFVATKGRPNEYLEATLPRPKISEEWKTFSIPLRKMGLHSADTVTMIGIVTENSDSAYYTRIGEIALRNPRQRFRPVKPQIKEIEVIRGRAYDMDFKMRYASREEKDGEKTYNDEVDTWYYEIFIQQKGNSPQMLTATESWAAYVAGASLDDSRPRVCRFGVRAVAPDGLQCSAISWSEYMDIAYDTPEYEPFILHHDIKPGELVYISYKDKLAPVAKLWKLTDAVSGETMASAEDTTGITTIIYKMGIYDLLIVNADGSKTMKRGFVRVADSTGGSLQITDPQMLSIPADVQRGMEYTIALWIKPNYWEHDRQGTNIISKNTIADSWPYNNWGDLWVQARPAWTDAKTGEVHAADELSFSTMGCDDMDSPGDMTTSGYSITPEAWTHIAVMQDSNKVQRVYVNGRLAAGPMKIDGSTRRELADSTNTRINRNASANIYIGGCGVYKAGFRGEIRDVQVWNKALDDEEVIRAMRGFADGEVPDALQGYYTFEIGNGSGCFPNKGSMNGCDARLVKIEGSGGEDTSRARYVECEEYIVEINGEPEIYPVNMENSPEISE